MTIRLTARHSSRIVDTSTGTSPAEARNINFSEYTEPGVGNQRAFAYPSRSDRVVIKASGQGAFGQHETDAQNRQLNDEANDKKGENSRAGRFHIHSRPKPGDKGHQAHHQARLP